MLVKFHILNLRIGGQTESINALSNTLKDRGVETNLPLCWLINTEDKTQLNSYVNNNSIFRRFFHFFLGFLNVKNNCIHHVVLPSPAWSWLIFIVKALSRKQRSIFQFEGYSLGYHEKFRQILKWLKYDPLYYLIRLLLNNKLLAKLCPSKGVFYIVSSRLQAEELKGYHVDPALINIIPNISLPIEKMEKEDSRSRLRLPMKSFIFGFAGALSHVKGIDLLLKSYSLVLKRNQIKDCCLTIAGIEKPFIKIIDTNFDIKYMKFVDIRIFMSAIDILVLPYRTLLSTTIQPSLILEALTIGTTVITTRVSPLDEMEEYGIEFNYCEPDDCDGLAILMENSFSNYPGMQIQSEKNKKILRAIYFKDVTERYIRCYKSCIP